jgi:hypothetical protein
MRYKNSILSCGKHTTILCQDELVNFVYRNNRCLLSQSQERHEYTVLKNAKFLTTEADGTYSHHRVLKDLKIIQATPDTGLCYSSLQCKDTRSI